MQPRASAKPQALNLLLIVVSGFSQTVIATCTAKPNVRAAKAGALNGIAGFEDFGKTPAEDRNNYQPRVGFVYDLKGDGRDVVRGGYGRYYDFGYTNANILFAAVNATGIGAGTVFQVSNTNGIRKADGTFFKVGDPIPSIA